MPINSLPSIPRFEPGQLIDAERLNQIVDTINQCRISTGPDLVQRTGSGGTTIGLGKLSIARHFKVTTKITAAATTAGFGKGTIMLFNASDGTDSGKWIESTNGKDIKIWNNVKTAIKVGAMIIALNVNGAWFYITTDCSNAG